MNFLSCIILMMILKKRGALNANKWNYRESI